MSRRSLRAPESIRSMVKVIRYSVLVSIAQKRKKVKEAGGWETMYL
jgi:hypothetical protein